MSKKIVRLLAILCLTLAGVQTEAAKQSFPLVCQGGGAMKAMAREEWRTARAKVVITFRKARYKASERAPGPGECAWLDRPIANNEPAELRYDESIRNRSRGGLGIRIEHSKARLVYWELPIQSVLHAIYEGKEFRVHVYRTHEAGALGNYFTITRVGR